MMKTRALGSQGLAVSAIGLGCMGMSFAYAQPQESEALNTLHQALELGCNFWDTAEVYGPYTNELLLGKALKGRRDQVIVATKFGFDIAPETPGRQGAARMVGLDSRPGHIREVVHASLERLGIETIDLLYQHRVDPRVPIEDVVGVMADLVREGKVRFLGLSEPSAATAGAGRADRADPGREPRAPPAREHGCRGHRAHGGGPAGDRLGAGSRTGAGRALHTSVTGAGQYLIRSAAGFSSRESGAVWGRRRFRVRRASRFRGLSLV